MTTPRQPDNFSYPPRGLSRVEACRYLGIGGTLFDTLIAEGRLPKPKRIATKPVWDRIALDAAFNDLPEDGRSGLDNMIDMARKRQRLRDR
jgi:predicted DNA-binding transcriptional regulator AlpA